MTCEESQLPKSGVEVEDVVVSNFHEGWERKGGVEVGEKRGGSRAAADDRPVDERFVGKTKGEKKRKKRKGKVMGEIGAA